jgi:hypothetical protein
MRRTPLRYRSKKQAALYKTERVPLVRELLEERPWCEFPLGCTERSVDIHELLSRGQGGSIVDLPNLRASCRFHNQFAEDHPAEAAAIGWKVMRKAAS